MNAILILRDRTRIGREVEPVPGTLNMRHRMGREYVIAEPVGGSDNETKLPIYLELSRDKLSEEEFRRIEAKDADARDKDAKTANT